MSVEEPAPAAPVRRSVLNRSAAVFTGASVRGHADPAGERGRAEPDELARIGLDVGQLHHRLARQVARDAADHAAVARRLQRHVVRGDNAGRLRHVLHDDGGVARQFLGEIARQQPRADVVVVADLVADDHLDLPALVEFLGALRPRAPQSARRQGSAAAANRTHKHHSLPRYSAARFCTSAAAALS